MTFIHGDIARTRFGDEWRLKQTLKSLREEYERLSREVHSSPVGASGSLKEIKEAENPNEDKDSKQGDKIAKGAPKRTTNSYKKRDVLLRENIELQKENDNLIELVEIGISKLDQMVNKYEILVDVNEAVKSAPKKSSKSYKKRDVLLRENIELRKEIDNLKKKIEAGNKKAGQHELLEDSDDIAEDSPKKTTHNYKKRDILFQENIELQKEIENLKELVATEKAKFDKLVSQNKLLDESDIVVQDALRRSNNFKKRDDLLRENTELQKENDNLKEMVETGKAKLDQLVREYNLLDRAMRKSQKDYDELLEQKETVPCDASIDSVSTESYAKDVNEIGQHTYSLSDLEYTILEKALRNAQEEYGQLIDERNAPTNKRTILNYTFKRGGNLIESDSLELMEVVQTHLRMIKKLVECSVCLEFMKDTHISPDCQHRFCGNCFKKSLQKWKHECPTCRIHIPTKRSLRADTEFDGLVREVSFEESFVV